VGGGGEWRYTCTHFEPQRTPVIITPGTHDIGIWAAPEPVLMLWRRGKSLNLPGIEPRFFGRLDCCLVAVPLRERNFKPIYLGVRRIILLFLGSFKDVVINKRKTPVGSARSQDDGTDYEHMAGRLLPRLYRRAP
jgi:hypothetical protein